MKLPSPRGALSASLFQYLEDPSAALEPPQLDFADPLADEDLQLALYCSYELHYRGFDDVDARREWDPTVLAWRSEAESLFESALAETVPKRPAVAPGDVAPLLFELAAADDGPSLSLHLATDGSLEEFREFVIHRSAYQLKEADPHSWAIPRLRGAPKSALIEIQSDEYGGGRPERMHSALFAKTMLTLGLDRRPGAYLDRLPGVTLATVNLMSLFGLHGRWRGAIAGHLAMFEMTSSIPNRRYGDGLRRLGLDGSATDFFDEHVEADAVHEALAAHDLAGGLAADEPELTGDILFGAECLLLLDAADASHLLGCWESGRGSLREGAAQDLPEDP